MGAYVAMLRGINVSGKNKIKMADLQAMFAGLGYTDVVTYIQSGNVVFKHPSKNAAALAPVIQKQIASDFSLDVPVIVRARAEIAKVLGGNPFVRAGADPAKLHVTFLAGRPDAAHMRALADHTSPPDEFRVVGSEVYLHCPAGYGNTKLNNTFWERRLETTATTRNWNTVTKLLELAGG